MNVLNKICCRIYQKAFHIAIPFLPYRKPEIKASISDVIDVLKTHSIKSVLIVRDEGIRRLMITAPLEELLLRSDINAAVYDGTNANPTTSDVESALKMYHKNSCEAIIGFGGGSSIDCAKAVGARVVRPGKSLDQMKGILKVRKKLPLLIAVPTTAGTGSETTLAAVITDDKTRHKYPINDFPLIPHYAVLCPQVTVSLPPKLTAATGMDALTHAVEAYIGRSTTKDTRADALKAVRLVFDNIFEACEAGNSLEARKNMLEAAYCAGSAFTKSYVGYVHAVAHSLGGQYNIPHGLANAVLLPFVLEAYGESVYRKLHELAVAAKLSDEKDSDKAGAEKFIAAIKKRLGIGDTFSCIKKEDVKRLAGYAAKEANPLYPVPKLMDAKELEQFYYILMEDKAGE